MTTNQTIDGVPREQMACMPVDRSYDVRAKMIIAFNEARKSGGDLDDALDAAYKSALRYSPNPLSAEQPAPVAVVLPEQLTDAELEELEVIEALLSGHGLSNLAGSMASARQFIDEVTRLNTK